MRENKFQEYWEQKSECYGAEAEKVLLLQTATLLYSLCVASGMARNGLILLHCKNESQAKQVAKELMPFSDRIPEDLSVTPKEMNRIIEKSDYNTIVFFFRESRYTRENLEQLRKAAYWGEDPVLIYVITIGNIVREYAECFSGEIYLYDNDDESYYDANQSDLLDEQIIREQISCAADQKNMIEQWVKEIGREKAGCMFQVSQRFLFLFCASKGAEKQFFLDLDGALQKTVETIEEEWEGEKELDAIANLFCRAVQNAAEWLPGIVNLNAVDPEHWDNVADMVWYDKGYYYLSEYMFRDICKVIKGCTSSCRMKNYLADKNILIMEGRSRTYGTVKVSAFNSYGERKSERRVKLRRASIDLISDMTLIEMFGETEEEI